MAETLAMQTLEEASTRELAARMRWTLARVGELINEARAIGWAEGNVMPDVEDSDAILSDSDTDVPTPMRQLARTLGLSITELDVLWLLVCIELDPALSYAARHLIAPGMNELSAQMIERLVSRDGIADGGVFDRLSQFALVETTQDSRLPLYRRPVRVHDRVIDLVRGRVALDRSLRDIATLSSAIETRRETASLALEMPSDLQRALNAENKVVIVATGIAGTGRASLLRHAISSCGRAVLTVRARELANDEVELVRQLRTIARECRLHDAWPLLLEVDGIADRVPLIERELLASSHAPVLATSRDTCTWSIARAMITIPVAIPDVSSREAMWRRALPAANAAVMQECASRYTIPPGMIGRGAATALSLATEPTKIDSSHVHRALRGQLERRLAGIARRIETTQTWDDLVLPIDQFDLLVEMVARVKHRDRVLDDWGFADKVGRGLGLSALLSGPPGTGKTMIAGLIAQELGLDLYQVDLSKIVSKYIGETEKQLSALFEAAESGHAIILFDEADSLFGKRTEVKSSNDRYANLEVNYLLQRIEAFSGITLLTTNHETAIDQAFMRRLAFHVRVPMPDEKYRSLLWSTMIPKRAPCADDLDFGELASEFQMSGGYIKNAVLRAAYLAADEGTAISNAHLLRGARAEYEAMGKVAYQPVRLVGGYERNHAHVFQL